MKVEAETIGDAVVRPSRVERETARQALAALARPRLTGSPGAAETDAELRRRLEAMGYRIRELPFVISTWPGRFGLPLAGVLLLIASLLAAGLLVAGRGAAALAPLLGLAAMFLVMAALFRTLTARLPFGRVRAANWIAHRPEARPRYLVAAHRDSKSQAISLALRVAAIGMAGIGWAGLLLLAMLAALSPGWTILPAVAFAGAVAAIGGIGLTGCWAGNDSPGALDNASGLATLLGVAERERDNDDVAFLLTDAEELGLAGAWAVARQLPPLEGIINLDGLDDRGRFYIVERYGWPRRGYAPHLAAALLTAAGALDLHAERRPLPVGVMVDHIAFAEAGVPALTVMRGSRESLQRAHRPDDDIEHLRGEGASAAVALVSGALAVLRLQDAERSG